MRATFESPDSDGVLLADASNAFNSLNHEVCVRNIRHLCPSLAPLVISTYSHPAYLHVDGDTLLSCEGTTQGDPITMPMYAICIFPLIKAISTVGAVQVWYVDDAVSGGKLAFLRTWWDSLLHLGPKVGYYPNPSKSVLLVKPEVYDTACEPFADTGITVKYDGVRYLGAAIGTPHYIYSYVADKVTSWVTQVERLSTFAGTQPQSAYAAFVHSLRGKWTFLCRTMLEIGPYLVPVNNAVTDKLIPAMLQRPVNEVERELLSLPCRHGGLGLRALSSITSQYDS